MGNINNSNDSEKKEFNYCILQFKKKNQIKKKKLTIRSEALNEVSCSFSPEVQSECFLRGHKFKV